MLVALRVRRGHGRLQEDARIRYVGGIRNNHDKQRRGKVSEDWRVSKGLLELLECSRGVLVPALLASNDNFLALSSFLNLAARQQVVQGPSDLRIPLYESAVEVRKSKEHLNVAIGL